MSNDSLIASGGLADQLLSALGEQLGAIGARCDVVVIGGAALLALGLLRLGLPAGFEARLHGRAYGPHLAVHFASRIDQIHFKLYALADRGPGKHEADLRALEPTRDELVAAARWSRTHERSEPHRDILQAALAHLGVDDADLSS